MYDFSFSGVKSAVLNYINGCKMKQAEYNRADIAASFQKAVTDVLVDHAMAGVENYGLKNLPLREAWLLILHFGRQCERHVRKEILNSIIRLPFFVPNNAAMIGAAAFYDYQNGIRSGWDLNAVPNLKLGER